MTWTSLNEKNSPPEVSLFLLSEEMKNYLRNEFFYPLYSLDNGPHQVLETIKLWGKFMSSCDLGSIMQFKIVSFNSQITSWFVIFHTSSIFCIFYSKHSYIRVILFVNQKSMIYANIDHRKLSNFTKCLNLVTRLFFLFCCLLSHVGIVLLYIPECWLPGATYVTVEEPFKR